MRSTPPRPDEFELSLIGPGRGECIVIHLGDNEWCVVDSCIPRGLNEPAAVEYLSQFENGALERIKLIVATHWHDDHIRGLASTLRRSLAAQFYCSQALNTKNFAILVALMSTTIQGSSGVDEFASIYEFLQERASAELPAKLITPKFAIENRTLLKLEGGPRSFPASIKALSPSDGTVKLAFKDFAQLIPRAGEPQRRIVNRAPNSTSVVLWVEVGKRRALLGADLEHTGQPGEGWVAVLDGHMESEAASVFKVPHHGSANADCPEVWKEMLIDKPIAIVTPFNGRKGLPSHSDLQRLKARAGDLYCTSGHAGKPPTRGPLVDKTIRRVIAKRRVVEGGPGHIRIRWSLSDIAAVPRVDLYNGAYRV